MQKIIKKNVLAKKIKFDNGVCWQVGQDKYLYGWAFSRSKDGELFDCLHAPIGYELSGDIIRFESCGTMRTCFQPHDGQVTRQESDSWDKENWIRCFGDDNHFYGDVHSVTYKNPTSKTGRSRTDACLGISIHHEITVIVARPNGRRRTMSIPIEDIIERHLYTYDSEGNRVEKSGSEILGLNKND